MISSFSNFGNSLSNTFLCLKLANKYIELHPALALAGFIPKHQYLWFSLLAITNIFFIEFWQLFEQHFYFPLFKIGQQIHTTPPSKQAASSASVNIYDFFSGNIEFFLEELLHYGNAFSFTFLCSTLVNKYAHNILFYKHTHSTSMKICCKIWAPHFQWKLHTVRRKKSATSFEILQLWRYGRISYSFKNCFAGVACRILGGGRS